MHSQSGIQITLGRKTNTPLSVMGWEGDLTLQDQVSPVKENHNTPLVRWGGGGGGLTLQD